MGSSNRERRAAKQRRRDQKRGRTDAPPPAADRGLSADALRRVLADTAADLAGGRPEALTELRHLLAEHLARRRDHVLAACGDVLGADPPAVGVDDPPPDVDGALGPAGDLATALAAHLAAGGTVARWADDTGMTSELAAVATVGLLARRAAGLT